MRFNRYLLVMEETYACDWEEYECKFGGDVAIVDTKVTDDPEYPDGMHIGHYCDVHGKIMLERLNAT